MKESAAKPRELTVILGVSGRHMPPSAEKNYIACEFGAMRTNECGKVDAADFFFGLEEETVDYCREF